MAELKKYRLKPSLSKQASHRQDSGFSIDYATELNPAQFEAVKALDGPVLVIAGAGSGKTRTLVYRVARLVESGVDPKSILLLTFTRKAAGEMLRRASLILDERCAKVSGGTFHSFASMVLRKYAGRIGYPNNFTIMDQGDAEDVINFIRKDLKYHELDKKFPKKKAILDVLSKSVNKGSPITKIIEVEYPHFSEFSREFAMIADKYKEFKIRRAVMDYDDLLVNLAALLKMDEGVRSRLSNQYRYVMVDEYQDTNRLQAEISSLVSSSHGNIMAVGDDSQSIYSFRGADVRNIRAFPKLFPGARIITLEENYRSTQPILNLTNGIIDNAREKYSKRLFTRNPGDSLPVYLEVGSEDEQSRFVAQEILELCEQGFKLSDIAVLFRAGWHSNDLEIELARRNIPFVKYGGFKFIESAHVKDALAFLRIVFNPKDTVSWLRILLLIPGIGPRKAGEIADAAAYGKTGFLGLRAASHGYPKQRKDLEALYEALSGAAYPGLEPKDQLETILGFYIPLFKKTYDDYNKRKGDIDSLRRIAEKYKNLDKMLTDLALEPVEASQTDTEAEKGNDKLTLSTIHSAKGLEWRAVFVIFMNDGFIPSARSIDSEDQIEEERRLLYVAATRAKEKLYCLKTNIEFAGRGYFDDSFFGLSKVSRFLTEGGLLDSHFEHWSLTEDGSGEEKGADDGELEYIDAFD